MDPEESSLPGTDNEEERQLEANIDQRKHTGDEEEPDSENFIPAPLEIIFKEEPHMELDYPNRDDDSVECEVDTFSPENLITTPPHTADDTVDNKRCGFCLKIPQKNRKIQLATNQQKIEFVLSTELTSIPLCCRSCWRTFEEFYDFKKSCLTALSAKPAKMVDSNICSVKIIAEATLLPETTTEKVRSCGSKAKKAKIHSCDVCGKKYSNKGSLTKHKEFCHDSKASKVPHCNLCNAVFRDTTHLKYHMNKHNGERPYRCQNVECNKSFFSLYTLKVHEKTCGKVEDGPCPLCGVLVKSHYIQKHMETHSDPKFECQICNRKFFIKGSLEKHWTTHEVLTTSISISNDLVRQNISPNESAKDLSTNKITSAQPVSSVKNTDSDDPEQREDADWCKDVEIPAVLYCAQCGKGFPTESMLNRHVKQCNKSHLSHVGVQEQCPQCPEVFKNQETLRLHVSRHNGERSFPCRNEGCTKAFFNTTTRNRHEHYCGKNIQLVCNICGAILKTANSLHIHMSKHKEPRFACEICGKGFWTRCSFNKHTAVHSDERKFECKVCGKRFKSYEANRVHQRIHTQEKPYACIVCGERFTYNCMLKNHVSKNHPATYITDSSNKLHRALLNS